MASPFFFILLFSLFESVNEVSWLCLCQRVRGRVKERDVHSHTIPQGIASNSERSHFFSVRRLVHNYAE